MVINKSVNQTLPRTVITAGATFLAVLSLYLFGGEVLEAFAFAMLVGIITGTYSTVFIASAIAILLSREHAVRGRGAPASAAGRRPERTRVAGSRAPGPLHRDPAHVLTYLTPRCSASSRASRSFCPSRRRRTCCSARALVGFEDPARFTVMIQLGSVLAIMWLYRAKIAGGRPRPAVGSGRAAVRA